MATFTLGSAYNADGYIGATGYLIRYNDCYILGSSFSNSLPAYATTAKDKIFTPLIYRPSIANGSLDNINVRLQEDSRNGLTLLGLANRGATLFVKIGKDGTEGAVGTLRELGTPIAVTANDRNIGQLKTGDAICMGFRSYTNTTPGLTGQYIFYIVNGMTANPCLDQIVWRVQFSFGGRDGNRITGGTPPVLYGQLDAYTDSMSGATYFRNTEQYAIVYTDNRDTYDSKGYNIELV